MVTNYMIATIIVGYKNDDLTISYVKNELTKIKQDNIIIVVNNVATEESNLRLANELNGQIVYNVKQETDKTLRFFVINVKENIGFARANNLGFMFLKEHFPECKYVLFSNNDIKIKDSNVVDVLISKLECFNDIGIITPNIIGINGNRQTPQDKPFLGKYIVEDWLKMFLRSYYHKKKCYAEIAQEGYHYTFAECFFMTKSSCFEECGMFDSNTFLYAEGLCLSERMLAVGLKYYFCPTVTVVHENSTTMKKKYNASQINRMTTEANNYYPKIRNYHPIHD